MSTTNWIIIGGLVALIVVLLVVRNMQKND